MDAQALRLFIVVGAAALLIGCTTTPPRKTVQPVPAQAPVGQPAPQTQTPPAAAKKQTQTPAAATAKESTKPPAPTELIKKGKILVTKEEYNKTFDDVHRLIEELNRIIADRDYHEWIRYLTPQYVETYSAPKTLEEISNQPMLKRDNLQLKSLKDYFLNVVVPSRENARLDDLEFVNKTQVKAITIIDGQRYILYDLRLVDGNWKVGVS